MKSVCGLLVLSIGLLPGVSLAAETGADLYKAKCVICHGADGSANTPMGKLQKIPDFKADAVQSLTDAQLANVVSKGKNKMPSYGNQLKPDQISLLVAYIRDLKKK